MSIHQAKVSLEQLIQTKRDFIASLESTLSSQTDRLLVAQLSGADIQLLERILQQIQTAIDKEIEQSWRDYPDRMGGQFTDDEINRDTW